MTSEPTVWVEIPASWVLPQGEFTFLVDGTSGRVFGPVLAIEPTMPQEEAIRALVGDEIAALRHDGPMSANGSADRAFTNALVIAERTARGGQR